MGVRGSHSSPGYVTTINTTTNSVAATISLAAPARGVDARRLDGLTGVSGVVSIIDVATDVVVSIQTGHGAGVTSLNDVVVAPDGVLAYVASWWFNRVVVINLGTRTVESAIYLGAGSRPNGLALTPDGEFLYVTDSDADTVSKVRTSNGGVLGSIGGFSDVGRIAILASEK